MEPQKRGYRLAAEVLLSQFRLHYSAASQDRLVMRLDHALTSQVQYYRSLAQSRLSFSCS
jgi:hypothetical protein